MRSPIFVTTLLTTGISSVFWLNMDAACAQLADRQLESLTEEDAIALSGFSLPDRSAAQHSLSDRILSNRILPDHTPANPVLFHHLNTSSPNAWADASRELAALNHSELNYAAFLDSRLNADSRVMMSIDDILNASVPTSLSPLLVAQGAAIAHTPRMNIAAVESSPTESGPTNSRPANSGLTDARPRDSRLMLADARWDEFINAHDQDINLRIQPRFSAGHTASGAYTNGLTRLAGWIPLRQREGENVTFAEPRFNVDNEGHVGGTVLIGHREYDNDTDRLWAGYLAWDIRETQERTFNQLGLGLETLGDTWDVHLNGYIPLGDRNATLEDTSFSSGLTSSTTFEDNLLVLSERQSETRILREDVSLGGFDIGTTVELADWNDENGDLRALASLYYLGGPGIDDDLGWRLGLELRPIEQIVMGVSVQDDEIFGTNVLASINVNLIRVRPKDDVLDEFEAEFEVVERLGEPIRRNPTIAVATNTDVETTVTEVIEPLFNPQNGRDGNPGPYRFIHVSLGANTNGDGTFENPYNNIDDAIADAEANARIRFGNSEIAENQIIYVDASASVDINAFEIPAGVRVLSQGPPQLLNGSNDSFSTFPVVEGRLPFSAENNFNTGIAGEESGVVVTLPGSGDGDFPLVDSGATNLITMNSNTVLSGFRIEDATGNAIIADGAVNVEIRDSFIANAGERGIFLENVQGDVFLFDNEITDINGGTDSGQGILIRNTATNVEVVARDQTISDARVGFEINITNAGVGAPAEVGASQSVEIESANISNNLEQGLLLTASDPGNTQEIVIEDTTIRNSGFEGIRIEAQKVGSQIITLADSFVTDSGDAGIRVIGGTEDAELAAPQEVFLFRNLIARNGGAGIDIIVNELSPQELGISDNIITANAGDGIQAVAGNLSFLEFVTDDDNDSDGIFRNTITGNSGQGIDIDANDTATVLADIRENTLENTATTDGIPELEVVANTNTASVCTFVLSNNATTSGSIVLNNNNTGLVQGLFQVAGLNDGTTLSSNITSTGTITFLPDISSFTEPESPTSCFTEGDEDE
ncbi:MAG: right-handed parallel beta-helix repeat-containing protein [Cyanothece sp. SIO2G6]|nr:right-handed parallel beta-helix repeat-containing protein [Cyanothece sp. SIO2G6]